MFSKIAKIKVTSFHDEYYYPQYKERPVGLILTQNAVMLSI